MSDAPVNTTSLMKADDLSVAAQFSGAQWGIFGSSGAQILTTNAVFAVEYGRDYKVSDYPQERGAFQSYNKVKLPFQAKITFIISDTRQQFLNSVEKAVESLDFVTVVTPEVRYPSANLVHYDYRRQKENASLIAVSVWAEEVRVAGQTQQVNTQTGASDNIGSATASTSGASTSQLGSVQSASAADATFATPSVPDLEPPT